MKLVRNPDGSEMHIVQSLDGYEGWSVLGNVARVPRKWERWNGRNFAEDPQEKEKAELQIQMRDSSYFVKRISELEARVAEMEANLANNLPM